MFERRNIQRTYLEDIKRVKDFLLSDKSREFFYFCFFLCSRWLLALADLEQRL